MKPNTKKLLPISDRGPYVPDTFVSTLRHANDMVGIECVDVIGHHRIPLFRKLLLPITRSLIKTLERVLGKRLHVLADIDATLFPAADLVNKFVEAGYVKSAHFSFDHYFDTPPLVQYSINHILTPDQTDGRIYKSESFSFGSDKKPEMAVSQALGEFIERYPLLTYKQNNFLPASIAQLEKNGRSHLDLSQVSGFSDAQKKADGRFVWDKGSLFHWTTAQRIRDQKNVLVPAQMVYWNYTFQENEPILRETNTNGAAAMSNYHDAVLGGLHELIQRDGLMVHWFNKITPEQIDPDSIPFDNFQKHLKEAEEYGFKVRVINLTTELGVATYGVLLEDVQSGIFPKRVFGLNAHFDPERALHRAFTEAWNIYRWMRRVGPSKLNMSEIINTPFSFPVTHADRTQLFGMPENETYYEFFWTGKTQDFDMHKIKLYKNKKINPKERLQDIVVHLESFGEGYTTYVCNVKHELIEISKCYSVRVIVPALIPLHLGGEKFAHAGGKRITDFAALSKNIGCARSLNPVPQPFP